MRKIIVIATAVATVLSTVSPVPGFAQAVGLRSAPATGTIDPVVAATIKAFPSGGQALTDRIRTLVLQNNDLAADVARYLTSREVISAAQREAVEKGLVQALNRLGIYAQSADGFDTDWLLVLAGLVVGGVAIGAALLGKNNNSTPTLVSPN
jgi:hypothetical protein